jgi:hypothetical protein
VVGAAHSRRVQRLHLRPTPRRPDRGRQPGRDYALEKCPPRSPVRIEFVGCQPEGDQQFLNEVVAIGS